MSCLAAAGVVLKERLGGNRSARRKTTRRPRNVLKPSRPMSCLAAAGVVWMSALALKCLSAGLLDLWRSLGQRTVSLEREGPWTGAHPLFRVFFLLQPGLLCLRSFFFNQSSFFGLVRPGGESVRDGDGGDVVRGPLQELALGRLALVGVPTDGGDHGHHDGGEHHRWPRLATPAHVLRAAAAADVQVCCFAEKTTAAAASQEVLCGGGPGPGRELTGAAAFLLRSSATRSSLITILLLQPVFFLRPWARRKLKTGTGTVVIGQRQWRCLAENQRTRWDS